jgi:hypothetical protein
VTSQRSQVVPGRSEGVGKEGKGYIKGVASAAVLEEEEAAISTTLNFVGHESESSGNDQVPSLS